MTRFNIVLRSILNQKLNYGVVVVSMAIGMACLNLIAAFVSREFNTDSFHEHSDRIYALTCDDPWSAGGKMYHCRAGSGEYMQDNFTQVEEFCRVNNAPAQKIAVNNETYFDQLKIIAASQNFFDFFSYQLLTNNPKAVLEVGNNLVISEELAKKYFGSASATGQAITLISGDKEEQMVVKGVFKKPVENTQINFDMVRPIGETDSRCYLKLKERADHIALERLFAANKNSIPVIHTGIPGAYYLEPLQGSYFDTSRRSIFEASRDKSDLWIALVIGLMIIGVATFNYLGLANNIMSRRAGEYAIRRINGGSINSLRFDFLKENVIVIAVSLALSFLLMLWIAPFFDKLTGTSISGSYIFRVEQVSSYLGIIGLLALLVFLFMWSCLRPGANAQKLIPSKNLPGKSVRFPAFNIFQFAVSVALIVCSIIIVKQMSFINNKPIGIDRQVLEIEVPAEFAASVPVFKEELSKSASIKEIAIARASPVREHFLVLLSYEEKGVEKEYAPAGFGGDENYMSTLGIQLIEGEGFTGNPLTDANKCLINESLAALFPGRELLGAGLPGMEEKIVAGIVKDFHYSDLKSFVEPAFISYNAGGRRLMVKAADDRLEEAKEAIAASWRELIPGYPLSMETIGARFEWLHRENKNYVGLIGACCGISVFLSMIGLFAISVQSSRRRVKEIGIRKTNGARIYEIMLMLNRSVIAWMVIALAIAAPIAWYAMNQWLENFAYKTQLSWWIFALAGALALGIALLTVSWQSWKAATRNPVEALRCE